MDRPSAYQSISTFFFREKFLNDRFGRYVDSISLYFCAQLFVSTETETRFTKDRETLQIFIFLLLYAIENQAELRNRREIRRNITSFDTDTLTVLLKKEYTWNFVTYTR